MGEAIANKQDDVQTTIADVADRGIKRFSLALGSLNLSPALRRLDEWDDGTCIHGVPDLRAVPKTIPSFSRSIALGFNLPVWQYFGLGSEEGCNRYLYQVQRLLQTAHSIR